MTTPTYEFGDPIRFVNHYGQDAVGTVINHDGDRLFIDYLGVGRDFDLTTMTLVRDPGIHDAAERLADNLADTVDLALVLVREATGTGHTTSLDDVLTAYGLTHEDLETGADPR